MFWVWYESRSRVGRFSDGKVEGDLDPHRYTESRPVIFPSPVTKRRRDSPSFDLVRQNGGQGGRRGVSGW